MSLARIVFPLLSEHAPLHQLVGDRIYPEQVPEGTVLAAVGFEEISTTDVGTIDALQPYSLRRSRVQINALAPDHSAAAAVLHAACAALQFQRGIVGGQRVVSIVRERTGPHGVNPSLGLHQHVADFVVTWQESAA
jgi:hypothetical protein